MDEVGLGKVLQRARQRAGLTQQQLCQQSGLSYSTLAKIERGAIKAPSIFTVQSIADSLGLSLGELIRDESHGTAPARKQSKSGIRFVYFDINGCMVRFFHRAFTAISQDTGAPAGLVESAFWRYNDAACRGELSLSEFDHELATALNVSEIHWEDYYIANIEPIQEVRDVATWASEHYQIGLLSNIMSGQIEDMCERDLLPALPYASIIDSSSVGTIKPEADIYRIAQDKAGVKPTEILLIDDSRTNLMAASHAGWQTMWFDDYHPDESVARIRQALEY
jgi:FMN phosphatase YigB (HAD superfamily)/DNA-binding Xre family transcriptional regulator